MLNAKKLIPADHIELSYDVLMKGGNFIQDPKNAFVLSKDLATQLGLTDEDYAKGSGTFDLGDKSAFISKFARVDQSKVDKVQDSLLGLDAWIEKSNQEDPPKYPILKETPTRPAYKEDPTKYTFDSFKKAGSFGSGYEIHNMHENSHKNKWDEKRADEEAIKWVKQVIEGKVNSLKALGFDEDMVDSLGESIKNSIVKKDQERWESEDKAKRRAKENVASDDEVAVSVACDKTGYDEFWAVYNNDAISQAFYKGLQEKLGQTKSTTGNLTLVKNNQKDIDAWDKEKAQAETDYNTYKNSLEIDPETEMPQIEYASKLYDTFNTKQWTADTEGISEEPDGRAILADGIDKGKYTAMGKTKADLVQWVDDEEMQKRAEIFKETEEKKIKNKEKKLDTEEAKLQTELTALNNDYTSVKGIIEANIQKSFSYCSNA